MRRLFFAPRWPVVAWLWAAAGCGADKTAASAFAGPCQLPASAEQAPATLRQTGCFSADAQPAPSLQAYEVNAASWSNGASKSRWLQLAADGRGSVGADGSIELPPGSGIFKEFRSGSTRMETRLMLRQLNGEWTGLSYVWNSAQTEATLSAGGKTIAVGSVAYSLPTQAQCMTCHNATGGRVLGLRSEQLDRVDGPSQLRTWVAAGVLSLDPNLSLPTPWIDPVGEGPLAARARSYLASNCAFCHLPGGASTTATDYRYPTALGSMGICDVQPTRGQLGIAQARLLAPGSAARSVLSARLHSQQLGVAMPPLGRSSVDTAGTAVVDAWIDQLNDCSGP